MAAQAVVAVEGEPPAASELPPPQSRPAKRRKFLARGAARLRPIWTRVVLPVTFFVMRPVAVAGLRTAVRKKEFWEKGLKSAYFHADALSPELLYRYRLPALVRGWEVGILRFVRARIGGDIDPEKAPPGAPDDDSSGGALLDKFKAALDAAAEARGRRVPVMILHGEQDNLVPVGNSCRLAAVLGVPLVKVSDCGHTPAEETPECFVHEMTRFVHGVRGGGE